jgi:hypothetical protein
LRCLWRPPAAPAARDSGSAERRWRSLQQRAAPAGQGPLEGVQDEGARPVCRGAGRQPGHRGQLHHGAGGAVWVGCVASELPDVASTCDCQGTLSLSSRRGQITPERHPFTLRMLQARRRCCGSLPAWRRPPPARSCLTVRARPRAPPASAPSPCRALGAGPLLPCAGPRRCAGGRHGRDRHLRPGQAHRVRVPELRAVPAHDVRGEHHLRAAHEAPERGHARAVRRPRPPRLSARIARAAQAFTRAAAA